MGTLDSLGWVVLETDTRDTSDAARGIRFAGDKGTPEPVGVSRNFGARSGPPCANGSFRSPRCFSDQQRAGAARFLALSVQLIGVAVTRVAGRELRGNALRS